MQLTDYLTATPDAAWDCALQCGVRDAVVRLPDHDFDETSFSEMSDLYHRFTVYGLRPVVIEPMPNHLHDHIKAGDAQRDECIDRVIRMMENLSRLNIRTICFNFMAYIGWLRTSSSFPARGGATVTSFSAKDMPAASETVPVTADEMWDRYFYFIRAVLPYAEKYGIRLALHPDDPPLEKIGRTSRIMISYRNIRRAIDTMPSPSLGVCFCQATYRMMGEDIESVIPDLADKIFMVHFRNVTGNKNEFHETFHDDGELPMGKLIALYRRYGVDVPIRVDHVPTLKNESTAVAGYAVLGRLFAIGYLKGLLEGVAQNS